MLELSYHFDETNQAAVFRNCIRKRKIVKAMAFSLDKNIGKKNSDQEISRAKDRFPLNYGPLSLQSCLTNSEIGHSNLMQLRNKVRISESYHKM